MQHIRGLIFLSAISSLILSGCATTSHEVVSVTVSPDTFSSLDCAQIEQEEARLRRKMREVSGVVDSEAEKSKSAQVVGWIFFWPAFFLAGQDKNTINQLSRLKGEYEALEQASLTKNCFQTETVGSISGNSTATTDAGENNQTDPATNPFDQPDDPNEVLVGTWSGVTYRTSTYPAKLTGVISALDTGAFQMRVTYVGADSGEFGNPSCRNALADLSFLNDRQIKVKFVGPGCFGSGTLKFANNKLQGTVFFRTGKAAVELSRIK